MSLGALERALDAEGFARLTLDPARDRATSLPALFGAVRREDAPPGFDEVLERGLIDVMRSLKESFPDNLFCDLDALVFALVDEALSSAEPTAHLERRIGEVVALNRVFGSRGPIRFRYAHDFIYGFDWARWVAREPEARAEFGPYSEPLLAYLARRGGELLALIAEDDATYPKLREPGHRNPFAFSREPADEARLHRALAQEGLLPVEAWRSHPAPRWRGGLTEARRVRAVALGIADAR